MGGADDLTLRRMSEETIARYSERYERLGVSPQALGWGSREHQAIRFDAVRDLIDLDGKDVLDWGCGFGDLATHLRDERVDFARYRGVDLNESFIREARRIHADDPRVELEVADPGQPLPRGEMADVVVLLGLANFEQSMLNTEDYGRELLASGFALAREAVICDFLSKVPTPGYAVEESVHYYDPPTVLAWGLALSPRVVLKHDHPPIPQREMMLMVRR